MKTFKDYCKEQGYDSGQKLDEFINWFKKHRFGNIENIMREIAWDAWRKAYEKQMDIKFEGTPYFGIYPLVGEKISFDKWYDQSLNELYEEFEEKTKP